MLLIRIFKADQVPQNHIVRHFPCIIGSGPEAGVSLQGLGVWDRHARLELGPDRKFHLEAEGDALLILNDSRVQSAPIQSGDLAHIGECQLLFTLAPAVQRSPAVREACTWLLVGAVAALQALGMVLIF